MDINKGALADILRWRDKYGWEHRMISKLALLKHGAIISKNDLKKL